MSFGQVIFFDPSKGGTVPNMCLDNVRQGFGITNKYASAWEAWQHTEQHTDPVPDGLDVPLYYSYTATIDGVTQNYGHINVRLKDGTVWSDGNIYASIDAYTANHWPKFVGWGESVNDYKIIQGGTMEQITPEALQDFTNWKTYGMRVQTALSQAGIADDDSLLPALNDLVAWKKQGMELQAQVADLQKQLASTPVSTPTPTPAPDPNSVVITKDSLWTKFLKWWNS